MNPNNDIPDSEFAPEEDNSPSKSARKREALSQQQLGEVLSQLKVSELNSFPLSDTLRAALDLCREIKSHSAHKRQLQYIGKLMRSEDIEMIQNQFEQMQLRQKAQNSAFHQLEKWRDRLIAIDGSEKDALTELMNGHPEVPIQKLRQLMQNNKKELAHQHPPKSARDIFKLLREHLIKG